ncbi:MAG: hypothetical protein WAM14_01905 [Candidatus Nitrosopolaris sp.]
MSRAYPEFYLTEEDIKKFVGKLKIATKRLFAYASHCADHIKMAAFRELQEAIRLKRC